MRVETHFDIDNRRRSHIRYRKKSLVVPRVKGNRFYLHLKSKQIGTELDPRLEISAQDPLLVPVDHRTKLKKILTADWRNEKKPATSGNCPSSV